MGTRSDWYSGIGDGMEWLGSTAWDGYPEGIVLHGGHKNSWTVDHVFDATTDEEFRLRLERYFRERSDVSRPADGWPWPWTSSHGTDFAYAFRDGTVYVSVYGRAWTPVRPWMALSSDEQENLADEKTAEVPDMRAVQRVTLGPRSGVMILGG